eukprot:Phypoly_transcript_12527.p1 GENE.Phypoly_transcript_12527~~Phypoly_transcript_12527.p1  ORF type:complete len:287 (+),score=39.06 Phypoly_transcript_12527:85-861(+)
MALIPAIVVLILSSIDSTRQKATYIHYAFSAVDPPYTMMGTLQFIVLTPLLRLAAGESAPSAADYFKQPTIYVPIICMIGQIVLFIVLLYYFEFVKYKLAWKVLHKRHAKSEMKGSTVEDDADVSEEKQLISRLSTNEIEHSAENLVVLQHLRKEYEMEKNDEYFWKKTPPVIRVAVEDMCLHIPKGEIFGMLGPNGAGKTTTIGMMVGDVIPTDGTAYIGGHNIAHELEETYALSGYCPQFDAFPDTLVLSKLHIPF